MALQQWFGALLSVGLVAVLPSGCSSSSGSPPADAGADVVGRKMLDSGANDGLFDMTTGKVCATTADCIGADGGPGRNVCSNQVVYTNGGQQVSFWPTPICLLAPAPSDSNFGNCDPAPNDHTPPGYPHFCDGPDKPSSPGFCAPYDDPPQPNRGVCLPKCTFGTDGTAQQGCPGFDTCVNSLYLQNPLTLAAVGYGYCQGTCQKDTDCTAVDPSLVCQTDTGFCASAKLARTKPIGAPCTVDDNTNGACNCAYNGNTNTGYCSAACSIGGPACPNGWACDVGLTSPIDFGVGTTPIPITAAAMGLSGICRPTCTNPVGPDGGVLDAGAGVAPADAGEADAGVSDAGVPDSGDAGAPGPDAGSGCPGTSTCEAITLVGPACFP